MGYINAYMGYYGYNKDKFRRYSTTLNESVERNVFIAKLNFASIENVNIDNVYIEKAYKWGSSYKETKELLLKDTFDVDNKPYLPYQIIIEFKEEQKKYLIYIPNNRKAIEKKYINDTIIYKVFIRDFNSQLVKEDTLKIWQ